ncbi:MAG TPA: thermonuclease family protein [Baekduia sp.]|nr:thermonuclease family protein [Baekduia sp.]
MRFFPWVLLLGLAAAFALSSLEDGDGAPAGEGRGLEGRVSRVVDGDTIHVQVDGRREKVRLIGVDTPESVKPGTPVECFAKAASAFTKQALDGRRVRLTTDAEERDRYGRLLAYVRRKPDGWFHNAELVRQGYAMVLTIPPNVAHAERFRRLAREAREAGRGLWRAC